MRRNQSSNLLLKLGRVLSLRWEKLIKIVISSRKTLQASRVSGLLVSWMAMEFRDTWYLAMSRLSCLSSWLKCLEARHWKKWKAAVLSRVLPMDSYHRSHLKECLVLAKEEEPHLLSLTLKSQTKFQWYLNQLLSSFLSRMKRRETK